MCDLTKFATEKNSCEILPPISPILVGPSCLRSSERKKNDITRNVSFPDDDSQIVTGILEPESPWKNVAGITNEDLITLYVSSSKKHGTYPIPAVLDQLSKFELNDERYKLFSLKSVTLNSVICETLEEIFKHIQFNEINLESTALDDEASVALFDMLEYYESATQLNISSNPNIGIRGWQACSRLVKKACCLEELEARNTTLNEVSMPILGRALKVGSQLQVLKLGNCNLSGRPLIILASALKVNSNLKELYLSENYLGMNDANQLGLMLKCNTTLQILDISHNDIKDVGFNYIIEGIIEQGFGLTVLMVWNNQLTGNIAYSVSRLLDECTSLQTLNVGQNAVGDEFLRIIKEALSTNKNILRLGLQSTSLTNESAFILSSTLKCNNLIQRIDMRDNNIQINGLESLFDSMETNTSLIRFDLDKLPRKSVFNECNTIKYKSLVVKIHERCAENEKNIMDGKNEQSADVNEGEDSLRELIARNRNLKLSVVDARKISLTCESLQFRSQDFSESSQTNIFLGEPKKNGRLRSPAPSPIPSPLSSPSPVRNRFQVSKVAESQSPSPPFYVSTLGKSSSRFKVTIVEPEGRSYPNDELDQRYENEFPRGTSTPNREQNTEWKDPSKITDRIRKLSSVPPVAIEIAKIPANLEKLIGLFQNPFVRPTKTEESIQGQSIETIIQNHEDEVRTNTLDSHNRHRQMASEDEMLNNENLTATKSNVCVATMPQKLTSKYISPLTKNSPNILEGRTMVLLQNHVPQGHHFSNAVSVHQTEKPANDAT